MVNDLIRRQAAIEAIVNTVSKVDDNKTLNDKYDGAAFRQHEILNIIESMPPAQQWIPVSERLPDENGSYLTTTRNGRVRVNHFYKYHGIFGYQNNAIAWMSIPSPYAVPDNEKPADDCPLYPQKASWSQVSGQATLCSNCGKAQNAKQAKGWRYCPHCGFEMEE